LYGYGPFLTLVMLRAFRYEGVPRTDGWSAACRLAANREDQEDIVGEYMAVARFAIDPLLAMRPGDVRNRPVEIDIILRK
jgi:hypothetical protein